VSSNVKAQIIQDTARVSVTQLFENDSNITIPTASYTFPLPTGCTVVDFKCRIGSERILKGKVKPRQEADDDFRRAVDRCQTAGLLEQHTPEIFTTTLGNIPSNIRVQADISFVTLLKYGFSDGYGLTTFTLPFHIAPRYGTPSRPLQQALARTADLRSLEIEVNVLAAEEIAGVECGSHDVNVSLGTGGREYQTWSEFVAAGRNANTPDLRTALVKLASPTTGLERDFILNIRTRPEASLEQPRACMETHPSSPNQRALMVTIPPKFMLQNQSSLSNREIIFVADLSGSMSDKINSLKSSMEFFLKGLPQSCHFNIWCFGSTYEKLWERSKAYSGETLQDALSYVSRRFNADMGGTCLLPALKATFNVFGPYQAIDIVVLTDGQVWDLNGTLDLVQQKRVASQGRIRLFALGIGDAVSHELVEGLAKVGGGYAEVIPAAAQERLEARVMAVLKAALSGHVGPLRIELRPDDNQRMSQLPLDPKLNIS
jgi:hypothetical protein